MRKIWGVTGLPNEVGGGQNLSSPLCVIYGVQSLHQFGLVLLFCKSSK